MSEMDEQHRAHAVAMLESLRREAEKEWGGSMKEKRIRVCEWLLGGVVGAGASYPVTEFERSEHDAGMSMPEGRTFRDLPPGKYVVFRAGEEPVATPEVEGEGEPVVFTPDDVQQIRDVIRVEGPENYGALANIADRLELVAEEELPDEDYDDPTYIQPPAGL